MTQFKLNQLVWDNGSKRKGAFKGYNRDMGKTARVEFIVKYDEETGLRTTKLETVQTSNLKEYKERKPKKYNPNEMYWMVDQFHEAFGHPRSNKPVPLSIERGTDRAVWTGEEALVEFIHQSSNNEEEFLQAYNGLIAGLEKAKQKSLGMEYPKTETEKIVGQSDALTDALYFIFGSFVEMGVKPFNLFRIVQEANMGKLHDGVPKYREGDGKIMKPENWERDFAPEPKLTAEIERQSIISQLK